MCEAFNIGGGDRVRLDRLLALIGRALGREPVVEPAPDEPGDVHLTAADLRRSERERSEEHTSELQSRLHLVCRLLLEKKKKHDPEIQRSGLKPTIGVTSYSAASFSQIHRASQMLGLHFSASGSDVAHHAPGTSGYPST